MQAIPTTLVETAAIDGAGPYRRFWRIVSPLLAPTSLFLLVINIVYAFFDTFGIIQNVPQAGGARATEILVYKVWYDGWHLVMATAILALLPPIAVVLAMQRWFVLGLIEPEK